MRPVVLSGRLLAAISLVLLVVACNKSPTSPTDRPGSSAPAASVPAISVALSGPDRLAPGQSAQYTVIVNSSDGVVRVPSSMYWSGSVFTRVDQSGIALGGPCCGGGAVTADVVIDGPGGGARRVSKSVIVLPDGTFRIFGLVTDEFQAPVPNALIEVTPGPVTTVTDSTGSYSLYGVEAEAALRISAYGYESFTQDVRLSGSSIHVRRDFQLSRSGPISNFAGNYTLKIDVTDGCPGTQPLPADLQHRVYDAVLTQSGLTLTVTLTEPRFSVITGYGNQFHGRVTDSGAIFELESNFNVAERLPDGFLFVSGSAATATSDSGLSGTLNGDLQKASSRFPDIEGVWLGGCAGRLAFTLTRR